MHPYPYGIEYASPVLAGGIRRENGPAVGGLLHRETDRGSVDAGGAWEYAARCWPEVPRPRPGSCGEVSFTNT